MEYNRLNAYHVMWIFVFFDLPVTKKKQMKRAARFRKDLEKCGFKMMQYSVYNRFCGSQQSADVQIKRIKSKIPVEGQVSILTITDKQYGNIINIWGASSAALPPGSMQLEIF